MAAVNSSGQTRDSALIGPTPLIGLASASIGRLSVDNFDAFMLTCLFADEPHTMTGRDDAVVSKHNN
jgi:hypothetical protein